jgi:hypothetical protein
LHLAVFAAALPWAATCRPARWYGKVAHAVDPFKQPQPVEVPKGAPLQPRAAARQQQQKQPGEVEPLGPLPSPLLHKSGWVAAVPAAWAARVHGLQWRMVAEPRPPPGLWQGGGLDFTLGGKPFRFTLAGGKRNGRAYYSEYASGGKGLERQGARGSKRERGEGERRSDALPSSPPTMRRSDEGTTTAIGVSAGADTIASDLLLRTLRRAAGTRDGGGGGGLEGPQRPPRHHRHAPAAPNREPTDPLAMATAAAVDAALGSGGYAAAWEAGPAAAQSTTPAAATAATAAATTSVTGSNRRRVDATFEAVSGEATAAAAVEVGLLDVVELLLSVGPFDLVAAVAATVAGAHTVSVARAAAASSGRGRLKDTAAAAAAAASHAFADSSPALVPRQ